MRDAIELEWAGIPTVALIHKAMSGSANSMKRLSGVPDYPYAVLDYPHVPLAKWDPVEVREIARKLAPQIIERLTKPAGG
ncbi:MAG: hypothetical protein EXR49_06980 [Dehalococcoidia bacterium]|nr:hypothetical protein [Dehalococcoidia bacterium]